jgi:hypothetical protein
MDNHGFEDDWPVDKPPKFILAVISAICFMVVICLLLFGAIWRFGI